jgi:ApbE superfamily uncharacterized protein (UPF0280 family)
MIRELGPGKVALDFGPTQMNIHVFGIDAGTGVAAEAARYAAGLVTELAEFKKFAARPQSEITALDGLPAVLRQMIGAVRLSGDTDLTPMAAVAGTVADMTADWLFARGIPKIIVNNGGDIAIRLSGEQRAAVGIAPALGMQPTHVLHIGAADGIGGVTTSGLGGRSFTKGIATAATVAAKTASIADACATSIGNAVFSPHPSIRMVRAEEADPLTDLVGHWVVREVGELPPETAQAALENGWQRAKGFWDKGIIKGCVIFIGLMGVMLPEGLATPLPHKNLEEGSTWKFVK